MLDLAVWHASQSSPHTRAGTLSTIPLSLSFRPLFTSSHCSPSASHFSALRSLRSLALSALSPLSALPVRLSALGALLSALAVGCVAAQFGEAARRRRPHTEPTALAGQPDRSQSGRRGGGGGRSPPPPPPRAAASDASALCRARGTTSAVGQHQLSAPAARERTRSGVPAAPQWPL